MWWPGRNEDIFCCYWPILSILVCIYLIIQCYLNLVQIVVNTSNILSRKMNMKLENYAHTRLNLFNATTSLVVFPVSQLKCVSPLLIRKHDFLWSNYDFVIASKTTFWRGSRTYKVNAKTRIDTHLSPCIGGGAMWMSQRKTWKLHTFCIILCIYI